MNNNKKHQVHQQVIKVLPKDQEDISRNKSCYLNKNNDIHINDSTIGKLETTTRNIDDKLGNTNFQHPTSEICDHNNKSCVDDMESKYSVDFKDEMAPIKKFKYTAYARDDKIELYIPPFKRRAMEQEAIAVTPEELERKQDMKRQRQSWDILKTCIFGNINRLNTTNIKPLIYDLFRNANLIRGRGLLAKAILRATKASPMHSHVYASLVAVLNTKLPEIGEIILVRLVSQFYKGYTRRDKMTSLVITKLIGNLFNHRVCHDLLILQILTLLLEGDPTDDSIDVAIELTKNVGILLKETSSAGVHAIMERLRNLLHQGTIGKRVTFKIEDLMKEKKRNFENYPTILDNLDLVNTEDQITLELGLDDNGLETKEYLDLFRYDPDFDANESKWNSIRKEVLNEPSDFDNESDCSGEGQSCCIDVDNSDNKDLDYFSEGHVVSMDNTNITIHDLSEKDMVNLRRTIYLTIMSSATFEECAHKLIKIDIPPGKEMELVNMLIECCSQERTFLRYYALIASRFCLLHNRWTHSFEQSFVQQYNTIHRLETNKLRNVAKLFAHLLHTDSLPWSCFSTVQLNEDETTSSSRIFLKILVQGIAEAMGIISLVKRFERSDENYTAWYSGIFPEDDLRKTRYAINFFTSIGLGPLTNNLREFLKKKPKLVLGSGENDTVKDFFTSIAENSDDVSNVNSTSDSSSCVSRTTTSTSTTSISSSTDSSCTSRTYSTSYSSSDYISPDRSRSTLRSYSKKSSRNSDRSHKTKTLERRD